MTAATSSEATWSGSGLGSGLWGESQRQGQGQLGSGVRARVRVRVGVGAASHHGLLGCGLVVDEAARVVGLAWLGLGLGVRG
eukprot:scaffold14951_cov60-Phaeocystis_antarctica.AAC.1